MARYERNFGYGERGSEPGYGGYAGRRRGFEEAYSGYYPERGGADRFGRYGADYRTGRRGGGRHFGGPENPGASAYYSGTEHQNGVLGRSASYGRGERRDQGGRGFTGGAYAGRTTRPEAGFQRTRSRGYDLGYRSERGGGGYGGYGEGHTVSGGRERFASRAEPDLGRGYRMANRALPPAGETTRGYGARGSVESYDLPDHRDSIHAYDIAFRNEGRR